MKQSLGTKFTLTLSIVALVLIWVVSPALILSGCNNKTSFSNKRDTGVIAYAPIGTSNWQLINAIYGQGKKYAYDDTTSNDFKIDTTLYFVYQAVDTIRNTTTKKVIYDSVSKRYNLRWDWVPVDKKQIQLMKFKIVEKTSK